MFRHLVWAVIALSVIILAPGCSNSAEKTGIALGQEFGLRLGQTAEINGEPLEIKFLELVGDSRCPRNAVCIWAGEVTTVIEVTYQGSLYRKALVKSGAAAEYATADFQEYEIRFDVQPYPEAGRKIPPEDYRLQLIISRKPEFPSTPR